MTKRYKIITFFRIIPSKDTKAKIFVSFEGIMAD
jgi:hypothetical protein